MKVLDKHVERGADKTGHGDYGMPRGGRKHQGFDLLTKPGDKVYSPISGKITKLGYCYANALQFRFVEISNATYRWRLMYMTVNGLKVGQIVNEGEMLGTSQDIAGYWGNGMLNHLHAQVWKNGLLTDPEPLLMTI